MNKGILNIVLISCLAITACDKKQPPADTEVPVNLMKVKAKIVRYYDKYPSTTNALSQVNLLPQVQGAVTAIYFIEGSHVKKGQKLYEIDTRIYTDNYNSAVANLKVAQGTLVQSQQDADRYEYLNKYNAVAKQLYDHAIITLDNSKNQVKAAEQAVKTAKTNLGYAVVTAPFDGTIGFSLVKLGDVVTPGTTVLNTVSTDNPMAVDFTITEKQLPKFEKMQDNKKPIDSLFTMVLPDNSIYSELGKISIIDRAVDPQTGTIKVRLVSPNPKGYLRVGMSGQVRIHNQDVKPQIVVPNKAIVEQMGEYFIYVAQAGTDSTTKKKILIAVQKKVQVGQVVGPNIVIKSGIDTTDRVVVDGIQTLHDGSKITTANKVGPSAGGKHGK